MSESEEMSESVAKSNPASSVVQVPANPKVDLKVALVSRNKGVANFTPRNASEPSANGGYARRLSFLSVSHALTSYPDTGESGDTYEVEASSPVRKERIVAPIGEYSE